MSPVSTHLRRHAAAKPDGTALDAGSGEHLSWAALEAATRALADELSIAFPDRRRPVAVLLDHGLRECIMDLALLQAGIPALAIPAFFTAGQRDHALLAAGAQAIIHDRGNRTEDGLGAFDIRHLTLAPRTLPRGTAKITFTSGSTGTPKGICLSAGHLNQVAEAIVTHVGRAHAGRHLAVLPPGVLLETVAGLYATLAGGGTYLPVSQAQIGLLDPFAADFSRLLRQIQALQVTSLILVPDYLAGLVSELERTRQRLSGLTLAAVGGARVAPVLLERAAAVGLPVRQGYGLTECGSVVTLETDSSAPRGSVGKSIGVCRVALAADGEILLHGPACLGSVGESRRGSTFHTGDLGRLDEQGRLWIEGRKSDLIVTAHGRNVSPEWVESTLTAENAIIQAMVYGDGEAALSALLVPSSPCADLAGAVAAANARLPAYARVHCWHVVPPFTPANGLLTGNGRLRRQAVVARLLNTTPPTFFQRLVLETADARAALSAVPQLQAGLAGRISRQTYVDYLTQAYHHVRHTVPLMQAARNRLTDRPALAAALDEYIQEESGHEQWILDDIEAAGGDSRVAAAGSPSAATAAMVDHAYAVVRRGNPVGLFGMIYVLESTSVAMAERGARALGNTLNLPPEAFRYLTSHGALDREHMRFFQCLMDSISDADDQQAILHTAREMFRLFAGLFAAIDLENEHAAV